MPIPRTLNQDFFKTWSPQMAYVLGFFAADGSMIQNNRGGQYIEFTNTDRSILEQIQRVTQSSHLIAERKSHKASQKSVFRIQIGSKTWFEDLSQLGFMQDKSSRLPLPNIPSKYFGDYTRGYFDGDGCVYYAHLQFADRKKRRGILLTLFTSGSKQFLKTFWEKLQRYGVQGGSLKHKTRGFELTFSHRDSVALHRIMYHTGTVPELFLPRKRDKLEKAIRELHLAVVA